MSLSVWLRANILFLAIAATFGAGACVGIWKLHEMLHAVIFNHYMHLCSTHHNHEFRYHSLVYPYLLGKLRRRGQGDLLHAGIFVPSTLCHFSSE